MSKVYYMGSDDTEFGSIFGKIGHFVSNAVHVAGKEIGHVTHAVTSVTGAVGNAIKHIPVVGAPLHTLMSAPYNLAIAPLNHTVDAAIHGKRIDKAVLSGLKDQVKTVKSVAPYAQMVVSFVPGIGTGVSAALGAGMALAEGQRIDKALLAGAIDALPGGPMAHAAASLAAAGVDAAARGEKFDVTSAVGTLANALPIPSAAKDALVTGATAAGHLATGKSISTTLADAALSHGLSVLPPDVKKAYQSGLAMGTAAVVQAHRAQELSHPTLTNKLVESGIQLSKSVPAIAEARKLAGPGVKGYDVAHGLLAQRSNLFDLAHVRAGLPLPDQKGFDMAVATKIGLVAHALPSGLSPAAQAGHAIVLGMQGMPQAENKASIMASVAQSESAIVGAKLALNKVAAAREPWYLKLIHALGFHPHAA